MAVNPYRIVRVITPIPIYIRYWKEPVQTRDGLPTQGNEVGDVRLVLEDKRLYFWDGQQWVPLPLGTFLGLVDTPSSYSGQGGKLVRVKREEDGLEFIPGKPVAVVPDDFSSIQEAIDWLQKEYNGGTVLIKLNINILQSSNDSLQRLLGFFNSIFTKIYWTAIML